MKKKLFIFVLGLIISGLALQAQKQNPFDSKKKFNTHLFSPSSRLNYTPQRSGSNPLVNATYHSIPFNPAFSGKPVFSNLRFNKKGQVIFVEGTPSGIPSFNAQSKGSVEVAAKQYLQSIKGMLHIQSPTEEFQTMDVHTDEYGFTHIKLQQYFQGVKVYGGQVFVHGKDGKMSRFNGEYFPTPEVQNLIPAIPVETAEEIAQKDLKIEFSPENKEGASLLPYQHYVPELVLYHPDFYSGETHLCWHLTVRPNVLLRYEYFIDAGDGTILNHYNNTCSDGPQTAQATDLNGVVQTINTYLLNGTYYLIDASRPMYNGGQSQLPDNPVGAIWTIDANNSSAGNDMNLTHFTSPNNTWNSQTSVSAHFNAGETYEYYKNTHGRNSINGQGGTIISICNIANENGTSMENAFWNGQAMFYGNGGSMFSPLAGALDVGAHEMGHGVVQNTCNLEYQGESGALNESMADISGCMVDREDWHLGEDVIINTNLFPTGFLRDMSNPHNGGSSFNDPCYQPANISEKYTGSQDNGGVHINSGIMNFAYFKFATAIGKDKAEKIWYKSMTDYLVKSSQFADARVAFVQAASDIYGANSTETNAVKDAFAAVGIGEGGGGGGGGGTPGQNDLETNPGQDFILSVDVNSADPNTLYISDVDATSFTPISTTQLYQKPSIVDNGSVAVFVTPQKKIRTIVLSSPYDENDLATDSGYDNIAVSKDGKRIAIVTTSVDSAIWVYDFSVSQWNKYHLYNPTFTPGVVTENVLYADALEWDYSGQYLIYDAYNKMQNAAGDDIDYWDMGVIRVWNNGSNTWGDGKIEKIFSDLPEGVSVGNPSLAKNSPYILAFDYYDANTGEIKVMAANLQTGETGVIFDNTVLGYPNYSKNDDKIIFNAQSNDNSEIIGRIGLQSNKIQPSGNAEGLIGLAKWGIWYATGNRNVYAVQEEHAPHFSLYPNPATRKLYISFDSYLKGKSEVEIQNMLGKIVYKHTFDSNNILFNIDISQLAKGNYILRWKNAANSITKKFVKL